MARPETRSGLTGGFDQTRPFLLGETRQNCCILGLQIDRVVGRGPSETRAPANEPGAVRGVADIRIGVARALGEKAQHRRSQLDAARARPLGQFRGHDPTGVFAQGHGGGETLGTTGSTTATQQALEPPKKALLGNPDFQEPRSDPVPLAHFHGGPGAEVSPSPGNGCTLKIANHHPPRTEQSKETHPDGASGRIGGSGQGGGCSQERRARRQAFVIRVGD